jgi:hypothetical protein
MARVPAILTLISGGVEEEFAAKSTEKQLVKLLLNKFVAVHLVNLVLALADGPLSAKSSWCIERALSHILFDLRG